jgi:hypothetical protein
MKKPVLFLAPFMRAVVYAYERSDKMNIQAPWSIRLRGGQTIRLGGDFWTRRKYHDDLEVAKRPSFIVEDDLDHLGALHKSNH